MDLIKSGSYTDIFYTKTCNNKYKHKAGYHVVLATLLLEIQNIENISAQLQQTFI